MPVGENPTSRESSAPRPVEPQTGAVAEGISTRARGSLSRGRALRPRDIDQLRAMARRRGSPRIDASGGDWSDEDISGLDLSGASFHGANLRNVRALGTDLSRADLREARLDQLAIDLYTCLRDARLPDSASDTYVHVYVRDAQDAGTLAAYGLESIPDNFACLEFREFLRLQPHYGYRTD